MGSPASIKKHPIHPMLVALPIGLWIFALACDVVHAAGGLRKLGYSRYVLRWGGHRRCTLGRCAWLDRLFLDR
jgi:uncharacterized membrane protein